ncbi:hypothetical protein ABH999_007226 [Bradyrhizobium yuanmingense]|uniref:Uncharacterized protein n=1 Tax=Bradyrhizobium yuanmingense TaxID=108015 RepID=A0A1C3XAQ0_9BRAD|nr:hypothetical protein GA0061099_101139 [Bradyrhizobium yuanmingense]
MPELTRIRLWRQFKPFVYLNCPPLSSFRGGSQEPNYGAQLRT